MYSYNAIHQIILLRGYLRVFITQIDVDWMYPGQGLMTMGYSMLAAYKENLELFFNKKNKKAV